MGVGVLVGLAASVAATLLLSSGTVLQAIDSRRVSSEHGPRFSLLGQLLRRRVWLLGTVIGYLAFPFELLALSHAPLVLVQPVQALGLLVVLAAGVRFMRERVSGAELVGVLGIIVGLGMVAWGSPASVDSEISDTAMAGMAVALCVLSFIPLVLGRRCGRTTLLVCAAIGFAGANMAVKGISDHVGAHDYLIALGYLTVAAVCSITGVINQMSAFQRHRAVEVVPATFAIPTFLPVVLGLLVLHEHWGTAAMAGAPFAAGGFLLVLGTVAVSRASAVTRVAVQAAA